MLDINNKFATEFTDAELGKLLRLIMNSEKLDRRENIENVLGTKSKSDMRCFFTKLESYGIIERSNKSSKKDMSININPDIYNYLNKNGIFKYSIGFIYRIYYEDSIVYVGQTLNLKQRIDAHLKNKIFGMYDYAEVMTDSIDKYESYYINKHHPVLNKQVPKIIYTSNIKELEFKKIVILKD